MAEAWISSECGKLGTGKIIKQYFKEKITDMMWVVFESEACRNATMEKLNKIKKVSMWSCEGSTIWVKQDAPLEERVTSTLLL